MAQLQETVRQYEAFITDRLQVDLVKTLDQRDAIYSDIAEYNQLCAMLDAIAANGSEMKTLLDIGHQFYVNAAVPDTTYVHVHAGYGFFVQLTHDEAKTLAKKRAALLQTRADKLSADAATIRARIKAMLGVIQDVMQL